MSPNQNEDGAVELGAPHFAWAIGVIHHLALKGDSQKVPGKEAPAGVPLAVGPTGAQAQTHNPY
jgi:hypothetical protein